MIQTYLKPKYAKKDSFQYVYDIQKAKLSDMPKNLWFFEHEDFLCPIFNGGKENLLWFEV